VTTHSGRTLAGRSCGRRSILPVTRSRSERGGRGLDDERGESGPAGHTNRIVETVICSRAILIRSLSFFEPPRRSIPADAGGYCPQCGSQITGRFCSACGAPTFADPSPASNQLATPTRVPWHRNGNAALGLALAPLSSTILWSVGVPIPLVSGWLAVAGAILGWRARGTASKRQGSWAVVVAIATIALVITGPDLGRAAPAAHIVGSAEFQIERAGLDGQCSYTCPMRAVLLNIGSGRNEVNASSGATVVDAVFNAFDDGSPRILVATCTIRVPPTDPGATVSVGCIGQVIHPPGSPPGFGGWPVTSVEVHLN